jgi:hypothetical protein
MKLYNEMYSKIVTEDYDPYFVRDFLNIRI